MNNKLTILLLSFGILFAACNTVSTEKSSVNETSANAETADNSENPFPPAPSALMTADFKLIDGGKFKLEDAKGKVILFNLWATWCGPCRAEMPELVELQDKYRDQGLEIVGLNVDDETPEKVNPFVEEMKLNYKVGWSDEETTKEFMRISRRTEIPQSFLIDREGRVNGVFLGAGSALEKLKQSVENLMNK